MALISTVRHLVQQPRTHVFGALCCLWFGATYVVSFTGSVGERILFALVSATAAYGILTNLGYFNRIRILPRRSDGFAVLFAVSLGAGIGHLGIPRFEETAVLAFGSPMMTSLWVGALAFLTHASVAAWSLGIGKRRRIVLAVNSAERDAIIDSYFERDERCQVEFLQMADLARAFEVTDRPEIDIILISHSAVRDFDADAVLLRAHLAGIPIADHRRVLADLSGRIRLEQTDLWTYLLEATPQTALLRLFASAKIVIEPVLATFLAVLLLPVCLPIMLLIPRTSPGPIFYRQRRIGYLGREFSLVKFRSMRIDAEAGGVRWASTVDDRTTGFGRFLRRTRLDEVPQLWNVIRGEMSFCGPRPERPEIYAALAQQIPLFRMRTVVRPGITGWAQVFAGYAASVEESALKLEYDLYYIQNMSPRLDVIVVLKTLWVALCGDSAAASHRPARGSGVGIEPRATA